MRGVVVTRSRASHYVPCGAHIPALQFDAIAPRRGSASTGVTDRVVNQLLTFLDGVETRGGVFVLAASSRPDLLDPALLRPGRLDKALLCGFPTAAERADIMAASSRSMRLSDQVRGVLPAVAACGQCEGYVRVVAVWRSRALLGLTEWVVALCIRTCRYTGADLQAIMYSAQLEAVHDSMAGEAEAAKQQDGDAAASTSAQSGPVVELSHLEKVPAVGWRLGSGRCLTCMCLSGTTGIPPFPIGSGSSTV